MKQLNFMMITARPDIAAYIERHGVSRIFMDQEKIGKAERQGHLNTHMAAHSLEEISAVAGALCVAELMVRLNPLHPGTRDEIAAVLDHGAKRLMLPMFTSRDEVACFLDLVDGRVPVTFLAETPQALVRLNDWIALLTPGHDEVHFGLNDLSLGLGLGFLFEPLAARMFDHVATRLNRDGIKWGIGGIARIGEGELPSDWVLGEHVRLGSQWIILSRAFHGEARSAEELDQALDFSAEIAKLRRIEAQWRNASEAQLQANQDNLAALAFRLGSEGVVA